MKKPIRVVDNQEWYTDVIGRLERRTRGLWMTATRTLIPVEVMFVASGEVMVQSLATDETSGKVYGIYVEQLVELEFETEIVRLNRSLLDF